MSGRRSTKAGRQRTAVVNVPTVVALGPSHARALLSLLVLGFALCTYLTYVHYRLHADPGWRSACDIDTDISCDAVLLSSWGSIGATPISLVGGWFYFVGTVLVIASIRGSRWRFPRSPAFVLFIGGALATALSLVLAIVSVSSIGSFCPICVALYVINIALTGTAWHAIKRSGETIAMAARLEREYSRKKRAVPVVTGLASTAVLAIGVAFYSHSAGGSLVCDVVAKSAASDRSLELVIYSDFQCPQCRDVAGILHPILREQLGAIRVVQRHYPLDTTCNPHAKRSRHPGSCRLALAAICAGFQGKAAELGDALFAREAPIDLDEMARSLGLDPDALESCMKSEDANRALRASIEDAAARDVHATPTLFLNDSRHVGRLDDADARCLSTAASWRPATKR